MGYSLWGSKESDINEHHTQTHTHTGHLQIISFTPFVPVWIFCIFIVGFLSLRFPIL